MEILLDVVSVEARPGYMLHLEFENGEKRLFDMSGYMDKKPFSQLKGTPRFEMASVENGTVVWPGNIDIAPETLYDRSRPAQWVKLETPDIERCRGFSCANARS